MATNDIEAGQSRSQSDALRGRASGVVVGSVIAFGWAVYAASSLASTSRYLLIAVAATLSSSLFIAGAAMMRLARLLPSATAGQVLARRRIWRMFWLNLVAEIILLNVAVSLLASPDRRAFWIPAISVVVGLHFWPMAVFFRVRSYWFVGGAMIAIAAVVSFVVINHPDSTSAAVHGEGLGNALVLWIALATGAAFALRQRREHSAIDGE
ncbi:MULTISPECIES: hypothetical protein [Sphingosinicellaceae]|uniref:hypothetical protein n=1 Tax=Sphingosinicellaceae TaxID=2820280 RepID=UPI001C1DE363|nr:MULTISPECIES: hypothetical protein [Polymorphobacter]QYE33473.1 hypothetical protein KZX46_01475 [Polymorphobacter sp. PAMC 29334]UAJ12838.1 hypothetical protein KTC28_20135 [Polymorphobacter megasporae]